MTYKKTRLSDFLSESKIISQNPDANKRIKVRLKVLGVEKRQLENEVEGATKQYTRKEGQFIYGKQNFHKGAFGIIPRELDGFESSSDLPAFDIAESCLPEFLLYFFKNGNYYLELSKIAYGVATQRINSKEFLQLEISLPSIEIQSKILANIKLIEHKALDIKSELTHQLSLVKQLRQAFLSEAMQGKLAAAPSPLERAGGEAETGKQLLERIKAEKAKLIRDKKLKKGKPTEQSLSLIDDTDLKINWTWCKADDLFFITKLAGFEYSEHIKLKAVGEVPVIRAQNVRPLNILKTNLLFIDKSISVLLSRCALTKQCLLVTFIGAGIGDVATFEEETRWHLAPNVAKMEPFENCDRLINVKFVNYFLMSPLGQKEIFKHIKATAQPSLSMSTIRDIDIPLPPLSEQNKIVSKLDHLTKTCDDLEKSIKQSRVQNEQLLQQVLKEALEVKEEVVV